MGQIDDYLYSMITPELLPGEQIMATGMLNRALSVNAFNTPNKCDFWLATATNMRLFLFLNEPRRSGMIAHVQPNAECRDIKQWWYQELREVKIGTCANVVAPNFMILVPHETLGPYQGKAGRYDMGNQLEGTDGQAPFCNQFRPWLVEQVAGGAFPATVDPRIIAEARQRAASFVAANAQAVYAEQQRRQVEQQRHRVEQMDKMKADVKAFLGVGHPQASKLLALAAAAGACILLTLLLFYMGGTTRGSMATVWGVLSIPFLLGAGAIAFLHYKVKSSHPANPPAAAAYPQQPPAQQPYPQQPPAQQPYPQQPPAQQPYPQQLYPQQPLAQQAGAPLAAPASGPAGAVAMPPRHE